MRRYLQMVLALVVIASFVVACGKKPKPVEEVTPTTTTTTTPTETKKTETPTEPTKFELKESQLATVYFDYDKYNLRADAKAALDANYDLLKQFPRAVVKIEGHCDERGTIEYNLVLGEKRARTTMEYLTGLGIEPNRISIISYGKERPAVMGSNEDAWSRNRRAEFRIVSQ